ncbi:glutathione S-transferase [Hahella sp. CR1]|uniref:glutathione S-transferase n=1 Tax=Hahella sp. CR1 TaxID=2992807 RepID=UPI002442675C|nr:glutathione S-transferase [Hahella sp. CR1]MDG9666854.1 glutathione S-transferase [Hahella sp. CR1]
MQLIGSLTSPFVRKIRIQLLEKGLPFSLLEEIPWNADTSVPKFNPLGKVPVLIDEHGEIWFDSPVIAEYIETLETRHRLVPIKSIDAVRVRQLEALADGVCEAAIAIFLEKKRPSERQGPEWIARQEQKVERGLAALEKATVGKHWVFEDHLTLADIAIGSVVGWYDFRFGDSDWRNNHPHLADYVDRLFKRDSFIQTQPPES